MNYSILIAILFLSLSSCSSLSKEECTNSNWKDLGIKDALSGNLHPLVNEYSETCSEFNIKIDKTEYLTGYSHGLTRYCTKQRASLRGENGDERHKACEKINAHFKSYYDKGFAEYNKDKAIQELKEKLIEDNGGKECSFSSDCEYSDSCDSGKCSKSDQSCSDDSECSYEGQCNSVSDWTEFNDNVSIDVCSET